MEIIEQRSPEWFKQRIGRVTGSSVGAILENAPYMTKHGVLRRMVRDYHGYPSEFKGNVATEWGVANEAGATYDFTLDTGLKVKEAPFLLYEDWAGASPDGFVEGGGLIEIKCPYGVRNKTQLSFKSIREQPHYHDQMQFQLLCAEEGKCYFYQWSPHGSMMEMVSASQAWRDESLPILKSFYEMYLSELDNAEHLESRA